MTQTAPAQQDPPIPPVVGTAMADADDDGPMVTIWETLTGPGVDLVAALTGGLG